MRSGPPNGNEGLRVGFEKYKDVYQEEIQKSISFIGRRHSFFVEAKAEKILELTRRYVGNPDTLRALDLGCGVGITDCYLTSHFKKLHGIDLSRGIVKKAAELNPKVTYRHYAGSKLPYASNSMDVTFTICVMHHVLPSKLGAFVKEMIRVTRRGGLVLVFEHNPFNPLTRVAVSRCELDEGSVLLSMGRAKKILRENSLDIVETKYNFFTPFDGAFFKRLEGLMGWLPLGAQYFVAGRKSP